MSQHDRETHYNRYTTARNDEYDFVPFTAEQSPELVLLAKQIQAQSYRNSEFVKPEALVAIREDVSVLSSDIEQLVEFSNGTEQYRTEYTIAVKNDTHDMDPNTGSMAAWRKYYAPLDMLPAYQYCREYLYDSGEEFLRYADQSSDRQLVEIEALSRTENAGARAIFELIRDQFQAARHKGEVWYFSIVETTYQTFLRNWGPNAIVQVGGQQKLTHPNVNNVVLIPAVLDVDNFLENIATDVMTANNKYASQQFVSFLFFSEGLSDEELGSGLVRFREHAPGILQDRKRNH